MNIPVDGNGAVKISDGVSDRRNSAVLAALLSSLFIHITFGWYGLNAIKNTKVQAPRQALEFKIVKPPDPVFTPPQPLPISPIPRAVPSPPKLKVNREPSAPKPEVSKPGPVKESVKLTEPIENKVETTQPTLPTSISPTSISDEASGQAVGSTTEAAPGNQLSSVESSGGNLGNATGTASAGTASEGAQGNGSQTVGPIFDADYLNNPIPPYPAAARKLKLQGTVIVRVLVNPQGKPEVVQLAKSSGASLLDGAALKAVKDWSFVPAREGGNAVSAWVDVPIRFRLN